MSRTRTVGTRCGSGYHVDRAINSTHVTAVMRGRQPSSPAASVDVRMRCWCSRPYSRLAEKAYENPVGGILVLDSLFSSASLTLADESSLTAYRGPGYPFHITNGFNRFGNRRVSGVVERVTT